MTIKKLISGIKILKINVDIKKKVKGIVSDHRKGTKDRIFVAIKGGKRDGNNYIDLACACGAVAIVTEKKESCIEGVPYILVENVRAAIAVMWSNYYSNPAKGLKTVAITGTNGKTTSAYVLYSILKCAKIPCGLISTIECLANDEKIALDNSTVTDVAAAMTTPDPEQLYRLYYIMKKKGVKVVVIEASSHALEQRRMEKIPVEIGAFTNLSCEHLDYHENMEQYFLAKELLMKKSKTCVVNADDSYGQRILGKYKEKSISFSSLCNSDYKAEKIVCSLDGCKYELVSKKEKFDIKTSLIGGFSVYNTAIAIACASVLKIKSEYIIKGVEEAKQIKGRLEKYKNTNIYIDYAHTPRAIKSVIEVIKQTEPSKRVIALFGCGGDRDKSKRPEMGRICTELCDLTIITSDNSRSENPNEILADIIKGIAKNKRFMVIPDRCEAIRYVAKGIGEQEILLLLGKGHEEYEITEKGKAYFSEKKILEEVLG